MRRSRQTIAEIGGGGTSESPCAGWCGHDSRWLREMKITPTQPVGLADHCWTFHELPVLNGLPASGLDVFCARKKKACAPKKNEPDKIALPNYYAAENCQKSITTSALGRFTGVALE